MKKVAFFITLVIFGQHSLFSQDSTRRPIAVQDRSNGQVLTLQEVFDLALQNSTQLKVSAKNIELARQRTSISLLYRLPDLSGELKYAYLSNADIWNPSFSKHEVAINPHPFTQFTIQATEVIFAGGQISNELKRSSIEEQLAFLEQERNIQDIKFLVASVYLDIYRLINQKQVYIHNASLASQRLKNIRSMQLQGMVTQNDLLRSQLILSDLQLSIRKTENNIIILNKELNMVTGRPDSAWLIPDSNLLRNFPESGSLGSWLDTAYHENHELAIAAKQNQIAATNIRMAGAERYPAVALFAGSSFQRPFLNTMPSVDIYYNVWQAGVGLKYDISSIYRSSRKMKAASIQLEQAQQKQVFQKQQVEVDIASKYINYQQAADELETLRNDLLSAEENYRIVERKYYNQLSLISDLIDAISTKLEAEIRVSNAQINMIYTYLQLRRSAGTL